MLFDELLTHGASEHFYKLPFVLLLIPRNQQGWNKSSCLPAGLSEWAQCEESSGREFATSSPPLCMCLVIRSCLTLFFVTPWTAAQLLCPCHFPGKNTWEGCHFPGISPTQGSKPTSPPLQAASLPFEQLLYHLSSFFTIWNRKFYCGSKDPRGNWLWGPGNVQGPSRRTLGIPTTLFWYVWTCQENIIGKALQVQPSSNLFKSRIFWSEARVQFWKMSRWGLQKACPLWTQNMFILASEGWQNCLLLLQFVSHHIIGVDQDQNSS